MKIKINKYLTKIVVLFFLLNPNGLYADFFEDITSQIIDNPKRLSYGSFCNGRKPRWKFRFCGHRVLVILILLYLMKTEN